MIDVLVVDDALVMRYKLRNILEESGFNVVGEAEDGKEAIIKYMELKPNVVTMDISMPLLSGIDALKRIRQYDSDAKIVMVSAVGHDMVLKEAILNGAKSFILKPFKKEQVIEVLNKICCEELKKV